MKAKLTKAFLGIIFLTTIQMNVSAQQNCFPSFQINQYPVGIDFSGYAFIPDSSDFVINWTWTIQGMGMSYAYNVQNFTISPNILPQGGYMVCLSIETNLGCMNIFCDSLLIGGSPCPIQISEQIFHVTIPNGTDGGIDISVSNATPPVNYLWNTGATTEDIYNLSSGFYSVTVTDANCSASMGTYVLEPWDSSFVFFDTLHVVVDTCLGFVPDSFYIDQVVLNSNNSVTITWIFVGPGTNFVLDVVYNLPPNSYGNYVASVTINCDTKSSVVTYMSYVNVYEHMSIEEFSDVILFYPNPANEMLYIDRGIHYSLIKISDMTGALVDVYYSGYEITLEEYQSGIYAIEIHTPQGVVTKKLIISK